MHTTALSQIAFFPYQTTLLLHLWRQVNSIIASIKPVNHLNPPLPEVPTPHPILIHVSCSALHTLTVQITLETLGWWKCTGSTSHPHSCTPHGHWGDCNHFFPGALSSTSILRSRDKMWSLVQLTAGKQTFHCYLCYCVIAPILMTRKVNSRRFYTLLSVMGTSHMDVGCCPKTRWWPSSIFLTFISHSQMQTMNIFLPLMFPAQFLFLQW